MQFNTRSPARLGPGRCIGNAVWLNVSAKIRKGRSRCTFCFLEKEITWLTLKHAFSASLTTKAITARKKKPALPHHIWVHRTLSTLRIGEANRVAMHLLGNRAFERLPEKHKQAAQNTGWPPLFSSPANKKPPMLPFLFQLTLALCHFFLGLRMRLDQPCFSKW